MPSPPTSRTRGVERLPLVELQAVDEQPLALPDAVLLAADGDDRVAHLVETRAGEAREGRSVAESALRDSSPHSDMGTYPHSSLGHLLAFRLGLGLLEAAASGSGAPSSATGTSPLVERRRRLLPPPAAARATPRLLLPGSRPVPRRAPRLRPRPRLRLRRQLRARARARAPLRARAPSGRRDRPAGGGSSSFRPASCDRGRRATPAGSSSSPPAPAARRPRPPTARPRSRPRPHARPRPPCPRPEPRPTPESRRPSGRGACGSASRLPPRPSAARPSSPCA